MSGGGKGDNRGNRRRPFRRRDRDHAQQTPSDNKAKKAEPQQRSQESGGDKPKLNYERPQWTPPAVSNEPLPVSDCPWCGKPIKDMSLAISDKNTGKAVHFDCIIFRLSESENLEPGEIISYIGGGRFGIIHYDNPSNPQNFTIKKIFEWENKDNRAGWRQAISDHFSVT